MTDLLRERLMIECQPQSLLTDIQAEEWEKKIVEALGDHFNEDHKSILMTFTVVLSCTRDVRFQEQGNESEFLRAFVTRLQKRAELAAAELWQWRLSMPHALWSCWFDQWEAAQQVFIPDPALLPGNMLDKTQQKDAADPATPLAAPANASPGN